MPPLSPEQYARIARTNHSRTSNLQTVRKSSNMDKTVLLQQQQPTTNSSHNGHLRTLSKACRHEMTLFYQRSIPCNTWRLCVLGTSTIHEHIHYTLKYTLKCSLFTLISIQHIIHDCACDKCHQRWITPSLALNTNWKLVSSVLAVFRTVPGRRAVVAYRISSILFTFWYRYIALCVCV